MTKKSMLLCILTRHPLQFSLFPANILYLSESKLVELPSLLPVQGCSVLPYPETPLYNSVSGLVNNKLIICGGQMIDTLANNNNNYLQEMLVNIMLYPSVTPWTMASGGCSSP